MGRFLSVDPIMDPGDPQQLHGYAYSNNNPTTFSDPSGMLSDSNSDNDPAGWYDSGGGCVNQRCGAASAPSPGPGPAPVTIVGVGQGGIHAARGQLADITALARGQGYQTNVISVDIEIKVQDGHNVGRYGSIPGIILGLSFTLLPICGDPISDHPVATASHTTRAEQAAIKAAQAETHYPENALQFTMQGHDPRELLDVGLAALSILPLPIGRLAKGALAEGLVYRGLAHGEIQHSV